MSNDNIKLFKHYDSKYMKDKQQTLLCLIIAIISFAFCILFFIIKIKINIDTYRWQQYVKKSYKTIDGVIEEVWLSQNANVEDKAYTVFYKYTIDSKTYKGNTIIGSRIEEWHKGVELPTTVWVNPDDYEQSFLIYDLRSGYTIFFSILYTIILLIFILSEILLVDYLLNENFRSKE